MMEKNSRLMVYVRVKPSNGQRSIIDVVDDKTLVFDPLDAENEPTDEYFYHGKKFKSIGSKRNKNASYTFDRVFDSLSSNYLIYETITRPMVDAALDGLNCSVFAYGATGSGKTYTMLGSPNCPGVIYYTSKDLFKKLETLSETDPLPANLKICYFEIYNEKIRDLLFTEPSEYVRCGNKRLRTTPERRQRLIPRDNCNLPVCEAPGGNGLVIPDLTFHTPSNTEELIQLLEAGNINRSQHPTDANADSSRSHAIFQIYLTRRRANNSEEYQLQTSKMSLIDLAGSERASVAYRVGNDRSKNLQREGGNINKSLLALGNCINALADPKRGMHVPYRNSKLTRLLIDSLGGKCRTAMIATICQQTSHYDETQSTLIYASRAKCIKLKPGRNFTDIAIQPKNYNLVIDNQIKQIAAQQAQLDRIKIENEELKAEVDRYRREKMHQTYIAQDNHANVGTSNQYLEDTALRLDLERLFEERRSTRLEIKNYESKYMEHKLNTAFRRRDDERNRAIRGSQTIRTPLEVFDKERESLLAKASVNENLIRDVIQEMESEFQQNGYGSPEDFDRIIEPYVLEKERALEIEEKNFEVQYAYDLAEKIMRRLISTEDLLLEAGPLVKDMHDLFRGKRIDISDHLISKLTQFYRKMEGKKNVVWKDVKFAMENDDEAPSQLLSVHENFSLNFLTPFRNNNNLQSRRLSNNLVKTSYYTPGSNVTFDASQ